MRVCAGCLLILVKIYTSLPSRIAAKYLTLVCFASLTPDLCCYRVHRLISSEALT